METTGLGTDQANNTWRRTAATKIQARWRGVIAKKQLFALSSEVYQQAFDEDSGVYYYYNRRTGVSSWEAPKSFMRAQQYRENQDPKGRPRHPPPPSSLPPSSSSSSSSSLLLSSPSAAQRPDDSLAIVSQSEKEDRKGAAEEQQVAESIDVRPPAKDKQSVHSSSSHPLGGETASPSSGGGATAMPRPSEEPSKGEKEGAEEGDEVSKGVSSLAERGSQSRRSHSSTRGSADERNNEKSKSKSEKRAASLAHAEEGQDEEGRVVGLEEEEDHIKDETEPEAGHDRSETPQFEEEDEEEEDLVKNKAMLQRCREVYDTLDVLKAGHLSENKVIELFQRLECPCSLSQLIEAESELRIRPREVDGGLSFGEIVLVWENLRRNQKKERSTRLTILRSVRRAAANSLIIQLTSFVNQGPSQMPAEERAFLKGLFTLMDGKAKGYISGADLKAALLLLCEEDTFSALDSTSFEENRRVVEFSRFCQEVEASYDAIKPRLELLALMKPDEALNIQKQFKQLDEDGSGEIDLPELSKLVQMMGLKASEEELKQMIAEADDDGNGSIDFTEAELAAKERFEKQQQLQRRQQEMREKQLQDDLRLLNEREKEAQVVKQERYREIEGLEVTTLHPGDGKTFVNKGDHIRVHYEISLENGTVIESTRQRGRAFDLELGEAFTIPGFERGLLRMTEGETAKIRCSPALGYGAMGFPPRIPAMATLVMKVELIKVYGKLKKSWAFAEGDQGDQ